MRFLYRLSSLEESAKTSLPGQSGLEAMSPQSKVLPALLSDLTLPPLAAVGAVFCVNVTGAGVAIEKKQKMSEQTLQVQQNKGTTTFEKRGKPVSY